MRFCAVMLTTLAVVCASYSNAQARNATVNVPTPKAKIQKSCNTKCLEKKVVALESDVTNLKDEIANLMAQLSAVSASIKRFATKEDLKLLNARSIKSGQKIILAIEPEGGEDGPCLTHELIGAAAWIQKPCTVGENWVITAK